MDSWLKNPAFHAYAITCVVLCANLLFLWAFSGARRNQCKSTPNQEDAARFGAALSPQEAEPVARVLRAHRNAEASIYPFLLLGAVFVMAGGSGGTARLLFGVFTAARLLHSYAYLRALQPWRTVSFALGGLVTVALMVDIVLMLVRGT